jgi:glycine cleavage system transcriptional repressor
VSEFAVTAIGRDRPGIVAGISGALLELEANLEDSQMSILGGHFAVTLIVSVPASVDRERLQGRLDVVGAELGLEAIAVNAIEDLGARAPRPSHVITVYGADHPGIVHALASTLADREINITGVETRLAGAQDSRIYVMTMEVSLADAGEDEVRAALAEVAGEAGVEVSVRPLEAEAL